MSKKALIFDCDGTLTDSLGHAIASFHVALTKVGEPRTTPEIIRYFGMSADRILFQVLGDPVRAERAYDFYKEHQAESAPQTRVFPGIRELLERAHQASVPLAVVTGRHRHDLEILLNPLGLLDYFSVIVTDNELSTPKPSPEGLLKALKLLACEPTHATYIGDSPTDIQAAHAAGMKAIAAVWDENVDRHKLLAAQPDAVALHPEEIWASFVIS